MSLNTFNNSLRNPSFSCLFSFLITASKKSYFMIFTCRRCDPSRHILLNNQPIQLVSSITYLGLILNPNLDGFLIPICLAIFLVGLIFYAFSVASTSCNPHPSSLLIFNAVIKLKADYRSFHYAYGFYHIL